MRSILIILISYSSGALPFSFWIGKLFAKTDIRKIGDGNPGASNVFKTGNITLGVLALLMDYFKGFAPVLFLKGEFNEASIGFILLCIAPILGHAFSPFLGFKGGKAIAVTFGIWSGLTLWIVPTFLGTILIITSFLININEDGWKVIIGLLLISVPLIIMKAPFAYWIILTINLLILGYKHREEIINPLLISSRRQ